MLLFVESEHLKAGISNYVQAPVLSFFMSLSFTASPLSSALL